MQRRERVLILILIFIFLFFFPRGYTFWIWSPKSKKWRNPRYSPLASPQAQLKLALDLFKKKNYSQALKEFRKLVIHFPDAKEVPEAQYYIGRIYEELQNMYQAFKEYQRVIDSYPYSKRINEIVERQYKIGEYFLKKERKKWLGFSVEELFEHPSIEIFKKVIQNAPYSEYAQSAMYKLGLLYKNLARYQEAIEIFKELIEKYPDSRWVEPAKYQLALCSVKVSLGPDYDQTLTREAKKKFQEFIAEHPEAEFSQKALQEISRLKEKEIKKYLKIAEFYKKQKEFKGAAIYYRYILKHYPETLWAEKARKSLEEIKVYLGGGDEK